MQTNMQQNGEFKRANRVLVIGAGISGIASMKCVLEAEVGEVTCFEQSRLIGGLWNYREIAEVGQGSVIESTVTNTSKEMTSFSDFPFPADWPNYMKHTKFLEYIEMFVDNFSLRQYIRFGHRVINVKPLKEGGFRVSYTIDKLLNQDLREEFDFIMVCNGKLSDPNIVRFENQDQFKGKIIHSLHYKSPEMYKDKNVCVVGFGNTGADIATEISRVSKQVYLSTRSGVFLKRRTGDNGLPDDFISKSRFNYEVKKHLPVWYKDKIAERKISKILNSSVYGIRPNQNCSKQFITLNDDIQSKLIQGSIILTKNIKRFHENAIEFSDGKQAAIDTVVLATGFNVNMDFLCPDICEVSSQVDLYMKMFLPSCKNLAFIGYINPLGAIPPVSEMQARYVCKVFKGSIVLPEEADMSRANAASSRSQASKFSASPKYRFAVNGFAYMERLAAGVGCRPDLVSLVRAGGASLARRCWFGAFTTQQYRLFGPNAWPSAAASLKANRRRMLTPYDGTDVPGYTVSVVVVAGSFAVLLAVLFGALVGVALSILHV